MTPKKTGEYTGTSVDGLNEAIEDALSKAGDPSSFKVIETTKSLSEKSQKKYHVTLVTESE